MTVKSVPFTNKSHIDEEITFTLVLHNAPVGAKASFSSSTAPRGGGRIGVEWTVLSPPLGGPTNPDSEAGQTALVEAGYSTVFTYRVDFNGQPVPANFTMTLRATKVVMRHTSTDPEVMEEDLVAPV